jgi:hypothetical protein
MERATRRVPLLVVFWVGVMVGIAVCIYVGGLSQH